MKIQKFLAVSLLSIASVASMAATQSFQQEINNTVSSTRDYFSSKINVNYSESNHFYAEAEHQDKSCKVNIGFNKNGDVETLSMNKEFAELTKLVNPKQLSIERELVLLHEMSHCQFYEVKDQIEIPGQSKKFNETFNYIVKSLGDRYYKAGNGFETEAPNYHKTLNETYADTSAMIILLKKYETKENLFNGEIKNSDLIDVINSFKTQREISALETRLQNVKKHNILFDVHNTYHTFELLLTKDNLKKINEIKSPEELQDFALNIANKATFETFLNTPKVFQKTFSNNAINEKLESHYKGYEDFFFVKTNHEKEQNFIFNLLSEKSTYYKYHFKHNSDNLMADVLKTKDEIFNKSFTVVELPTKPGEITPAVAVEKLRDISFTSDEKSLIDQSQNFIDKFRNEHISKTTDIENKDEIQNKISSLRNKFLETSKTKKLEIK